MGKKANAKQNHDAHRSICMLQDDGMFVAVTYFHRNVVLWWSEVWNESDIVNILYIVYKYIYNIYIYIHNIIYI